MPNIIREDVRVTVCHGMPSPLSKKGVFVVQVHDRFASWIASLNSAIGQNDFGDSTMLFTWTDSKGRLQSLPDVTTVTPRLKFDLAQAVQTLHDELVLCGDAAPAAYCRAWSGIQADTGVSNQDVSLLQELGQELELMDSTEFEVLWDGRTN